MSDLRIITSVLGPLHTNCYFICDELTRNTVIIDPADNVTAIREKCLKMDFKPAAVLLTHGHIDHIMAAVAVKKEFDIPIYAGKNEKELLSSAYMNCAVMMNMELEVSADILLDDKEKISPAGFMIQVIATPGHTSGSVCYYIESESILISGDTLFRGSYGRTDLPTGCQNEIEDSIKNKLFTLPEDTSVYPGHGGRTTIGYEKRNNMLG